jgi:anionic cell wall polymer biosynthesis LytR-Cps2A-Psr (LCP) family protein
MDAFVLTGFVGFERLVDAVGGIDVTDRTRSTTRPPGRTSDAASST